MPEVVVVGGGIGGLSCAAEIARTHTVTLIEREDALGYHSSGRSAAVYIEPYLNDTICRLTQRSREFFDTPGYWHLSEPLLHPRGDMRLASEHEEDELTAYLARWLPLCPSLRYVAGEQLSLHLPQLKDAHRRRGVWNPQVFDIDVHALSEGCRRQLLRRGGQIHTAREFLGASHRKEGWDLRTSTGQLRGTWLLNAAGAWADQVALRCGVEPIGLQPKRRTMVQIAAWHPSVSTWPMSHDAHSTWYMKPEGQRLLISPADETPCAPMDARAEEEDVALAIDRIEHAFDVKVERVLGRWAGLRSFAADNLPVIGRDPSQPYFLWCAGQGGYGIQTSPALAELVGHSLRDEPLPEIYQAHGMALANLGPERLRPLR